MQKLINNDQFKDYAAALLLSAGLLVCALSYFDVLVK